MTFLWILLGIIYVACWIYFGLSTFRKGHYWMFWIGFFFPFLWIIGALIRPDSTRRRHGLGATVYANRISCYQRSLLAQPARCSLIGAKQRAASWAAHASLSSAERVKARSSRS